MNAPYHHGDLKATLLTHALAQLERKGADALSMREMAKAIDVSHTAAYRHFADKRALLEALAVQGFDNLRLACEQAVAAAPPSPRQRLQASGQGDFGTRLAHYLCEQAQTLQQQGHTEQALDLYAQAIQTAPQSARARMEQAKLLHGQGETHAAFLVLMEALDQAPQASGQQAPALDKLLAIYRSPQPSLDVLDAIVSLQGADATESARDWYVQHLEKEPSLVAAAKWIAGEKLEHEQFHPQVQRALDHAVKPLTRYRCAACGFEAKQHFWQCPGCQTWDSYPARRVEEL